MRDRLIRRMQDESGITALETAIILIAFVVVAAVFAFTVLSAGTTSTEKGKEAILSGLEEVSSSLELRGSVLGTSTDPGATGTVSAVKFTVGNVAGGSAIDLTDTSHADGELPRNTVVIDYRDLANAYSGINWAVDWAVRKDADNLLEDGELAIITVTMATAVDHGADPDTAITLGTNTNFAFELKPPRGGVLLIQKTTPSYIDAVIDFH